MTKDLMFSVCPLSLMRRLQVRGSQQRMIFSVLPLAMIVPEGLIAKP
jgi:hypothetical protein